LKVILAMTTTEIHATVGDMTACHGHKHKLKYSGT
jgi:hypothetical protein